MSDMTHIKSEEVDEAVLLKEENRAKNNVPCKNMLKKIANIFIPIIPRSLPADWWLLSTNHPMYFSRAFRIRISAK